MRRVAVGLLALVVSAGCSHAPARTYSIVTDRADFAAICERDEPRAACAQRVREELRRELDAAPRVAPIQHTNDPECQVVLSEDTPRTTLLALTLESLGSEAAVAAEELLRLAVISRGGARTAAYRALVAIQHPRAVEAAEGWLESSEYSCRKEALRAMQALGPVALPALHRMLLSGDWPDRIDAAEVLAKHRDVRSIEPLRQALRAAPFGAQAAAARALGHMGAPAADALEELRELATTHWSDEVRDAAALGAWALGAREVRSTRPRCSAVRKTAEERWSAKLGAREVVLKGVATLEMNGGPACPLFARGVVSVGDVCVKPIGRGEWGGQLILLERGVERTVRDVWHLYPVGALVAHDGVWVLEAMEHLRTSPGAVLRIHRTGAGWELTEVVQLPGTPVAVAVEPQSLLVLSTRDTATALCPTVESRMQLLRISPSGEVTEAE